MGEMSANTTCSQTKDIEYCQPPWQLIGAAVLCHLLVSDVESDGEQESPQVDQLAEDAALGWSGGGVTDVGPVQWGVVQGNTTVEVISVIVITSRILGRPA